MVELICMPRTKVPRSAIRAPNTAMATAPPTWRQVLKTALAVPACPDGTLATIDSNPRTAGTRGPKHFESVPLTMFPMTLKAAEGRNTSPAWVTPAGPGGSPRGVQKAQFLPLFD